MYITGHSLGGALATLAALDHRRRYPDSKVTMYNFGSPRVGNRYLVLYVSYICMYGRNNEATAVRQALSK